MSLADAEPQFEYAGAPAPWFVGFTKPRQEARAVANLRRQGFDCHLPVIRVPRRVRGDVVWQAEAMFPRYVFVRPMPGAAPLERVRSTFGMSGLVRFAGIPATVDDSLVNELLAKGEAHRETLFAPGTPVRFVDGPLLGLEGVFERAEGEGRAIVLLEFLARKQQVRVATHQLSRA